MVRQLLAVVAELEQRIYQLLFRILGGLDHRLLYFRIILGGSQYGEHLRIARFFAGQRRRVGEHRRKLVEKLFREYPPRFLFAGRRRPGHLGSLLHSMLFIRPSYSASGYIAIPVSAP